MVEIPSGVNVHVDGHTMTAKGPAGEVRKTFHKEVQVKVEGNAVSVSSKSKALLGTSESIVKSMLKGAKDGFKKNMKLLYAHFPISIEIKGKDISIKNFLGEKMARKAKLIGATKVEAKGQAVSVSGPDKEAVGQTIANMRAAMKIKDKDGRVFQDGMYDTE